MKNLMLHETPKISLNMNFFKLNVTYFEIEKIFKNMFLKNSID